MSNKLNEQLIPFPVEPFTYWLNRKEKRVFLLSNSPGWMHADKSLSDHKVGLIEWGKDRNNGITLNALDFLALIEIQSLIPYYPKYTEDGK